MAMGQVKDFTFYAYWNPKEESVELRQIGNLRPPDELIERAYEILHESRISLNEYKTDSEYVRIGDITVGFIYVAGEPEKNEIHPASDEYKEQNRAERPTGDLVTGEFEKKLQGRGQGVYQPYQDKGWLELNGEYYTPDDEKPEDWSSR